MTYSLPLPPCLNQTYKIGNRNFYKAEEAKAWEKEAYYLLKSQNRGKKPLIGQIDLEIDLYLKFDRDEDSSVKIIQDILAKAGIYENDKQVIDLEVHKYCQEEGAKCEILVYEINSKKYSFKELKF